MPNLTPVAYSRRRLLAGLVLICAAPACLAQGVDQHPAAPAENPATEVKLREFLANLQHGQPNFDQLEPLSAEMVRQQLPMLKSELSALGPVQSLSLRRSEPTRGDTYLVAFANGSMGWRVGLTPDGKIVIFDINTGADR